MAEPTIIDLRQGIDAAELRRVLIPPTVPQAELYRTVYGRSVDLARIHSALLQADSGILVELTDLESEMMSLDPHLSAVLRKRIGSIQCLPWRIEPAQGAGVDPELAEEIAGVVRQHLKEIPNFSERLVDLAWAVFFNRASLEIHWAVQSGRIRWRPKTLEWIHPRRLAYGSERELLLINTFRRMGGFLEQGFALRDFPGKFLSWTPRLFNEYPEREGLGPRTLYWAFFKRFSWRMRNALTELFGIPWRIVEIDKDAPANKEAIDAAYDAAEKLGETTSAVFGKGMRLVIPNQGEHTGSLFGMNSEECNHEMSKLVLGTTSTTDSTGNRAESIIGKGEQDISLSSDAEGIGASVQRDLVAPDVLLNYGDDGVTHCCRFVIDATPPRDAAKEQDRLQKVVMLGVPVSVAEIREVGGVREPADDEPFVVAKSPGVDAMGNPLPAVPVLIDPNAPAPQPGPKPPPVAPAAAGGGLPQTADDELAAAGALEDQGLDGQAANAEAEAQALARQVGIPIESAREALAACDRGDLEALERVRGLGTEDMRELMMRLKPAPMVFAAPVTLPFAGYEDFEACVLDQQSKGHDAESAARICGALESATEAARHQLKTDTSAEEGAPARPPFRW
jgi:phage gp29-like protein